MADRLTQPAPYDGGFAYGGVGVVPRRQQDPLLSGLADAAGRLGLPIGASGTVLAKLTHQNVDPRFFGIAYLAEAMPLRLLRVLLAQDGTAQMAAGIEAALAFGAGNVRFVAVKDWRKGRGVIDDDATAEVNRVFSLYQAGETRAIMGSGDLTLPGSLAAPSAIPAALPLLLHAVERINDTGHVLFEATGDIGTGVTGIYDFDSLNCRFRDAEINTGGRRKRTFRVFEQQSKDAKEDKKAGQIDGWQILAGPGIASVAWKGSTDNPYGIPRNGAALAYLLRKAARRRDLGDWLHNTAFPKLIIEQAVSALFKLAAEFPDLLIQKDGSKLEASTWVAQQVQAIKNKLNSMAADDVWVIGEGEAYVVNPSNITGLTDVLHMERMEEIQSLNMLPSLVGVTDGGTQAYAEVQWLAQTKGLGLLSAYASAAPVHIGNYHFRLLGEDLIVRAEFDDLPPIDPQKAAAAQKVVMEIQEHLAAIGVNSPEYFAQQMSGSGAVNLPALKDYLERLSNSLAQMPAPSPAPGVGAA